MAIRTNKPKTQNKTETQPRQRAAQIFFALFAVILILSMVLSAVSTY